MSIWGNPVMMGGSGGGNEPIYLLSPDEMDELRADIGGTSSISLGGGTINTPRLIVRHRVGEYFQFYNMNLDGTAKEYFGRGTNNLGSIAYPQKISYGTYSKLYIKLYATQKGGEPRLVMGLGRALAFGSSSDFTMNILNKTVINNDVVLNTLIESELDISSVSEDFYFGLYVYDVQVYIREFCLMP